MLKSSTMSIKYLKPIFDNIGDVQRSMYTSSKECLAKTCFEWKENLCAFFKEHTIHGFFLLLFIEVITTYWSTTLFTIAFEGCASLLCKTL